MDVMSFCYYKMFFIFLAGLLLTSQATSAGTISRTVCNHGYVPNPQIVEIDYLKSSSAFPCRVYYTKNQKRVREGAYNNESGGCERIEKNIVGNLVDGGFVCSHSIVVPAATRNAHVFFNYHSKTPSSFNVSNSFMVSIDEFPQEEFAHMFVGTLKRVYPRFSARIYSLPERENEWVVSAGTFISMNAAKLIRKKLEELHVGSPNIIDVSKIVATPNNLDALQPDWQRFAIADCYRDGKISVLEMEKYLF